MNQTKIAEGWNVTMIWEGPEESMQYNISDIAPLVFPVIEDKKENVTIFVYVPANASFGENTTITINLVWNSWEYDEFGEIQRRLRGRSETIFIRVE